MSTLICNINTRQQYIEQNKHLVFFNGGGLAEACLSSFVTVVLVTLLSVLPAAATWLLPGFDVETDALVFDSAVPGFDVETAAGGNVFSTFTCSAIFEAALMAAGPANSDSEVNYDNH